MDDSQATLVHDIGGGESARIDIIWRVEKGKIVKFSINMSILGELETEEVYRIDTAHGVMHEHKFWQSEKAKKIIETDYNKVFNDKRKEVSENYLKWCILFKKKKSESYG